MPRRSPSNPTVGARLRRLRTLTTRITAAKLRHESFVDERNALWSELNDEGVSAAELGRQSGVTRMAVVLAVQKFRGSRSPS